MTFNVFIIPDMKEIEMKHNLENITIQSVKRCFAVHLVYKRIKPSVDFENKRKQTETSETL
jgi:hypothetical protein